MTRPRGTASEEPSRAIDSSAPTGFPKSRARFSPGQTTKLINTTDRQSVLIALRTRYRSNRTRWGRKQQSIGGQYGCVSMLWRRGEGKCDGGDGAAREGERAADHLPGLVPSYVAVLTA